MTASSETPAFESVHCAYCQGVGLDRWGLMSPLSFCSACGGSGTQQVQIPHRTCAHCAGDGAHPHLRVTCTTCSGAGVVYVPADAVQCPRCVGKGVDPDSELYLTCLRCGGSGWWWSA
jgi:DnaJ-class molecular chaperone